MKTTQLAYYLMAFTRPMYVFIYLFAPNHPDHPRAPCPYSFSNVLFVESKYICLPSTGRRGKGQGHLFSTYLDTPLLRERYYAGKDGFLLFGDLVLWIAGWLTINLLRVPAL